jgi:glutamyl-tRNA reductase
MNLQLIGCSHHHSSLSIREKLAFTDQQIRALLRSFYDRFPQSEAVLLSTCNRTELYVAGREPTSLPSSGELISLLTEQRAIDRGEMEAELFMHQDRIAVRHLFSVAASLDSMIVGETQILSQVKKAYQLATELNPTVPITHQVFQTAIRVARRVANDTELHAARLSVPSVAVGVFARQIFERLDNKKIVIIGAGEMAEETMRYIRDAGGTDFTVVNRTLAHAQTLAVEFGGRAASFNALEELLTEADFVISTTGASEPIVSDSFFERIEKARGQKPLLILDLAVPRDLDPKIGNRSNVYLYTLDDLQRECELNRQARLSHFQKAEMILNEETERFFSEWSQRSSNGTIWQLKQQADQAKWAELKRLFNKIELTERQRVEVEQAFNRLVNKILHPPLQSIREEESHHGLVDALKRLFQLKDG